MWQDCGMFFSLGVKMSKDNFTFTPRYSGILILLNSKIIILFCEVNIINDQARHLFINTINEQDMASFGKIWSSKTNFSLDNYGFSFSSEKCKELANAGDSPERGIVIPGEAPSSKQHPCTTSCSHYYFLQCMLTAKVQRWLYFPCSWC